MMDWSVVFAIVAFAALLQLAFFWYYMRSGSRTESVYPQAAGESGEHARVSGGNKTTGGPQSDGDTTVFTCGECGFDNHWDPTFTYCANCVAKLGR